MASFTGYLSGGLIGGTPDYAGLARGNEKRRQAIVDLGLNQINSVFGGGTSQFYNLPQGGFDPSKTYYRLESKGFQPYWSGGRPRWAGSGGGSPSPLDLGAYIRGGKNTNPENLTESLASFGGSDIISGLLGSGTPESPLEHVKKGFKKGQLLEGSEQSFEGFQPGFYDQRMKDYINYALPQLSEQYRNTRNALNFGLANRGLVQSSARDQEMTKLEKETGQARQTIADTGRNQANELRQQVENARQNAINYLYQSGDPAQATSQAISAAAGFRQPSAFAPIANMFSNLLAQYYTSNLLNQGGAPSYVLPPDYSVGGGALGPVSTSGRY